MDFQDAVVAGIPLIFVVMGLVEWVKRIGVSGWVLQALSMAFGMALGVLYRMSLQMPVDFMGWFGAIVYGLALGLVASGVYDAQRSASRG